MSALAKRFNMLNDLTEGIGYLLCQRCSSKNGNEGTAESKTDRFTDLSSAKDDKGTALFSYCASALRGAEFIVLQGSSVCLKRK